MKSHVLLTSSRSGWRAQLAGPRNKEPLLMECSRCHGLMVVDHFIDIQNTGHLWLCGWRCVSCGDVVDPEIIEHRRVQQSQFGRLAQTLKSKVHKTRDVVKLSA